MSAVEVAPDPDDPQAEWLFTFGYGQPHEGRFVRIVGTFRGAREEMVRRHGRRWSFQYPAAEEPELREVGMREFGE